MATDPQPLPGVGVVIATRDRPQLLARALESVLAQDYPGVIDVAVVFDRTEPDHTLVRSSASRQVRVLRNARTPGLAGARNTGILALDTELVGFCDDDDTWLPGKLAAQVDRLRQEPAVQFVTTAMEVDHADGARAVRRAGTQTVTFTDLARSRLSMLHASSFLFRRAAMLGPSGFGLVEEDLPRSSGEDWDLLLRAARQASIAHIDAPLVRVSWGGGSYFSEVWADKIAANLWLSDRYPQLRADKRTWAMMQGKLAFGHAASGHRRDSLHHARTALRANWREPRTLLAFAVLAGVPAEMIVRQLNRRGRSI